MKHKKINRLIRLLTALQSGRAYGADELAGLFGTVKRTIFRDLKDLKNIGIPCRYDPQKRGYIIDPQFFLPPVDLNLQEALGLLMLVHNAGSHIQAPFRSAALLAALKIESNLPAEVRHSCNTSLKNISIYAGAQAPIGKFDTVFSSLLGAVTKHRKVYLKYDSFFENKIITFELNPYHLTFNRRAWYVIGFSRLHKEVRTFKLNRIKELRVLNKCFVNYRRFNLNEYFGNAWSMIPEGKIYNIRLRFLPKVARNVTEVFWHKTQSVTHNKDGSVTVGFRVDGLGEILWWVLGYGDQVEVITPKSLRNRVRTIAQNMINLNRKF